MWSKCSLSLYPSNHSSFLEYLGYNTMVLPNSIWSVMFNFEILLPIYSQSVIKEHQKAKDLFCWQLNVMFMTPNKPFRCVICYDLWQLCDALFLSFCWKWTFFDPHHIVNHWFYIWLSESYAMSIVNNWFCISFYICTFLSCSLTIILCEINV